MACKACLMGDYDSFVEIVAARNPAKVKNLGRGVSPWSQEIWDQNVLQVAKDVVLQKFAVVHAYNLNETRDKLIAETTKRDKIWGIGIDLHDRDSEKPNKWRGTNILGWALMMARYEL